MPSHKSAEKRVRQSQKKKEHNKYYAKSTRSAVKKLKNTTDKQEAQAQLPRVFAMLDKLAKKNVIHKNKTSNLKSKLNKHVNSLS